MTDARRLALADSHRRAQARLAEGIRDDVAQAWRYLDLGNLNGSFRRFAAPLITATNARRAASSVLGLAFYENVRDVSRVTGFYEPVGSPFADVKALTTSLAVTGPVNIRASVARGADPLLAATSARGAVERALKRHVLDGGREAIGRTTIGDSSAKGTQRVSDGKPCAFCAMLVSRGAVYKSMDTASFRSHDGCGCSAVPFFDLTPAQTAQSDQLRALWEQNPNLRDFRRAYGDPTTRRSTVPRTTKPKFVPDAAKLDRAKALEAEANDAWKNGDRDRAAVLRSEASALRKDAYTDPAKAPKLTKPVDEPVVSPEAVLEKARAKMEEAKAKFIASRSDADRDAMVRALEDFRKAQDAVAPEWQRLAEQFDQAADNAKRNGNLREEAKWRLKAQQARAENPDLVKPEPVAKVKAEKTADEIALQRDETLRQSAENNVQRIRDERWELEDKYPDFSALTPSERLRFRATHADDDELLARWTRYTDERATLTKHENAAREEVQRIDERLAKTRANIAAANDDTPGLDALPRMAPDTLEQATQVTNPLFGQPRYDVNCVHVVNSHELRRRGYDVTATPLPDGFTNGRNSTEALHRWRDPDGKKRYLHPTPKTSIVREMKSLPEGARGWVVIRWKGGGGHIFQVENVGGKVIFSDSQNAKIGDEVTEYFTRAKRGGVYFARVDDLRPTDAVLEFVRGSTG